MYVISLSLPDNRYPNPNSFKNIFFSIYLIQNFEDKYTRVVKKCDKSLENFKILFRVKRRDELVPSMNSSKAYVGQENDAVWLLR